MDQAAVVISIKPCVIRFRLSFCCSPAPIVMKSPRACYLTVTLHIDATTAILLPTTQNILQLIPLNYTCKHLHSYQNLNGITQCKNKKGMGTPPKKTTRLPWHFLSVFLPTFPPPPHTSNFRVHIYKPLKCHRIGARRNATKVAV